MAPRRIIIDTDPGVDDILAILLAFAALPEELEVLLISITYGNIDLENCLRNVVSLFYHVEREIAWRKSIGSETGFETLQRSKPIIALGPSQPLADEKLMAAYFHGVDGLGNIHHSHPHLTPADTWKQLFAATENSSDPAQAAIAEELNKIETTFEPSRIPGHKEILRILSENEPDSITIVAIGPLTNLALAAAEDPETFLRVKEVVVMGGSVYDPGNQAHGPIRAVLTTRNQMTPVAEFNTFADTIAAARVYALTAPKPETTMPPVPPVPPGQKEGEHPPPYLKPYPTSLSRRLSVTLFPLDITERHILTRGNFQRALQPHIDAKSPLAEWVHAFMSATFDKAESLRPHITGDDVGIQLHDPLCIWYCMSDSDPTWQISKNEDIRVETAGQWTRGMCIIDRRNRKKGKDDDDFEVPGDHGGWIAGGKGNRLDRCVGSPGEKGFGKYLLERIFTP